MRFKRKSFLVSLFFLFTVIGSFSVFRLLFFAEASTNITSVTVSASSWELGATGVTHTYTFTVPQTIPSSGGYISLQFYSMRAGTAGIDTNYCDASLTSVTDDGNPVDASMRPFSSGPGVCSGQGVVVEDLGSDIAAGSIVVVTIADAANPSLEGVSYPYIMDNYYNQTDSDDVPTYAFGTPIFKATVTGPDGTTPVGQANVWIHNDYYTKWAGNQTDAGGNIYLFENDFGVPNGEVIDDTYAINVESPDDSDYTNANIITGVTVSTDSTTDYTADGEGPILLTQPLIKGTMVVPSGCSTCTASAGDPITDVDIDIHDTSFNPSNSQSVRVDDNGVFKIGGMAGSPTGTTYQIEFRSPYDMSNYKGLIPPAAIEVFVVYDTDEDGVADYVKYDSDDDDVLEQINSDSLPINLGNFAFRLASKRITGKVVNENGTGVANVTVHAFKMMNPEMAQDTTDANGDYALLLSGGNWMFMPEIDFSHNYDDDNDNNITTSWVYCGMGKSASFTDDTSTETKTNRNFTVRTADGTITGLVKGTDGQVWTGGNAEVNVYSKEGCGSRAVVDWMNGTFSVNVPTGTYNVNVHTWQAGYAPPPTKTVTVTSGTVSAGIFTMGSMDARISGRLWADENGNSQYDDGEGVDNIRVEAFKLAKKFDEFAGGMAGDPMAGGGGTWSSISSDTDGTYELPVTKGTWIVNVMADPGMMGGYSTTSVNYIYTGVPAQVQISTDSGQSTNNNFQLQVADATINGRVVNSETDEGVGGVYGYAFAEPAGTYGQGAMMGAGMGSMVSNSAFTLKVPAGDYRIGVDFPPEETGYTPLSMATVTAVSGETVTVDVPVAPNNATVRVQFKDVNDSLVTDLSYAEIFMDNGSGGHQWQMFSGDDLTNGYVDIDTSAGVWNVGYFIDPSETNYMSEGVTQNKVTVTANQTVTKDITLRVADSTISGTVRTPDGDPLAGVFVSLDSRKAANYSAMGGPMFMRGETTGADGTYSLTLPAGTYQVSAFFPPSATVDGEEVSYLNPEPQEATISSSSPATVNFTFAESDATLIGAITLDGSNQGAFVTAYSDKGGYNETTSATGSYSLNVTSNATWYVRAIYETGNSVYLSDLTEVVMEGASSKTQNLALEDAGFTVPDAVSTTYNCASAKKISLSNGMEISIPASSIKPSSVSACNSEDSSSNVTITVSPTAQMSSQDKSIPVGVGYEISAKDGNGTAISDTFSSNVTLTIPYSDEQIEKALGGAVDEDLLGNGYWDTATSAWKNVDNQVIDEDSNTMTISTSHFTLFGVLAASDASAVSGGGDSVSSGVASGTTSSGGVSRPMAPKDTGSIIEGAFNRVGLMIPSGALTWDANFEIEKIEDGFNKPRPPLWIASGPYETKMKSWWNGAEFSEFLKPVTLIVRYDPYALGEIPESSLRLNYYDEDRGIWRPINSLLIKDRHEVVAVVTSLYDKYALIGGFGYQGAPAYTGKTVTAEADSGDLGIEEEIVPEREVKEEAEDMHPSAVEDSSSMETESQSGGWFGRLLKKIVSWIVK